MKFPDFNIGYVFGYNSRITDEGILVTFLGETVRILFSYAEIEQMDIEKYTGGQVSWDVIRWGKCPPGTQALKISLKQGLFKQHLIVFNDLQQATRDLKANYQFKEE